MLSEEFVVRVDGVNFDREAEKDQLDNCSTKSADDILNDLMIEKCINLVVAQPDFSKLAVMTENTFQKSVFSVWAENDLNSAINTADLAKGAPSFMLPQEKLQEKLKFSAASIVSINAKPDMTAVWSPVVVEVKCTPDVTKSKSKKGRKSKMLAPKKLPTARSAAKTRLIVTDFEVLNQGVTRVAVKMRMHAFLSFTCSFAITERSAWVICGRRTKDSTLVEVPIIDFWKLSVADFAILWQSIEDLSISDRSAYLTDDGPSLLHILGKLQINSYTCRVKKIAVSSSRVYSIYLPKVIDSRLGIDMSCASFVIKLVDADVEFESETFALEKIRPAYAIGWYNLATKGNQCNFPCLS
jgi:hypothetical protein